MRTRLCQLVASCAVFWLSGCATPTHNAVAPGVLGSQTIVRLDVAAMRQRADAREPFALRLGDKQVSVRLKPNAVWSEDCVSGDRDQCVSAVQTYSGQVLLQGVRTQVRLTIGADFVSGYVDDGRHWWFIEPMRRFFREAAGDEHMVYRSIDLIRTTVLHNDTKNRPKSPGGIEGSVDLPLRRMVEPIDIEYDPADDPGAPGGAPMPAQLATIRVHMLADLEYAGRADNFGLGRQGEHASLVNMLDGIYRRTANLTLVMASSTEDARSSPCLVATTSSPLLSQVQPCFSLLQRRVVLAANDLVHMTSGKRLEPGFLVFGQVRGIAFQPGRFGLSSHRIGDVIGSSTGVFPNLLLEDLIVAAHEIGHNLDGCHEERDDWCDSWFLFFCVGHHNTIMNPVITGATMPIFSAGNFDPDHNNRQRMLFNANNPPDGKVARACR